jgi:hypothetical protein
MVASVSVIQIGAKLWSRCIVWVFLKPQITPNGIAAQVNRGADMNLAEFRQVSPVVVDLIKSMLSTDPAQRPTTAQVLRNSWIVGGTCLPYRSINVSSLFWLLVRLREWRRGTAGVLAVPACPFGFKREQFFLVVAYSDHSTNRK